MKLYYHPASTTCRPIMLFAAEAGIDIEYQLVDLFTGELEAFRADLRELKTEEISPIEALLTPEKLKRKYGDSDATNSGRHH